jgi:hypothetical protein
LNDMPADVEDALTAPTEKCHRKKKSLATLITDYYGALKDLAHQNRVDDEQYIVRLVGQVIRVSLETVRIVKSLPNAFALSPVDGS